MNRRRVLIETSWNVKESEQSEPEQSVGINRNIVECKAVPASPDQKMAFRINRNIVECKVEESYKARTLASCINRNIVECKVRQS